MTVLKEFDLFGIEKDIENDKRYTTKVQIPHYEPRNEKPNIHSLVDDRKYRELLNQIYNSSLPEEEKEFLRMAATRHIVFNYSRIADYYAHSSKQMQELMENSALVIIDIDNAIANGYVTMSKNIEKIVRQSGDVSKSKEGKYTEEDFRNGNPFDKGADKFNEEL